MSSSFTQGGLELDLVGFKEYLRNLERIDKQQRATFEREFKGTGISFQKFQRDAKNYERQLRDTQRQQEAFNSAVQAIGLSFGARELIQFGRESINLAREQAKAEAQLAAGIQSTGGAANIGSNELRILAAELQNLTNFGDEATIQMEALLLTFTNIREDEFRRAVPLIQDLAVRMGTDLNSAALQLAKALNAPTQNLGALGRAGVQFDESQRDLIASMDEAGNVAGAQAIILNELETQVGGSARAAREADEGIDALGNSFGDLREQIGFLLLDLNKATGLTDSLANEISVFAGSLRGIRFDLGLSDDIVDQIAGVEAQLNDLIARRDAIVSGGGGIAERLTDLLGLDELNERKVARLNERIEELQGILGDLKAQAAAEDVEELADAQDDAADATRENAEANEELQKALEGAVRQAEQLALNFARAQEDAARKAARQTAKLERDQARAREKLLVKQQKELDKFEEDRLEQLEEFEADRVEAIADTQDEIAKEERRAQRDRQRQQERFFRQLRQAEDRFNLDRIQSQRRFTLEETRLRAEGDILGLMRLREDFALSEQEASENFDLQQRQAKENQREQTKDQEEEQEDRLAELKQHLAEQRVELEESLEEQRADLLESFDEQLADLQESQIEQREALAESLAEQEEDRRISQQRQLEDLGRSLAAQEDLTAEGAAAIAQQLEEAFGEDGVADQIMSGFTTRQESAFQSLFESITEDLKEAEKEIADIELTPANAGFGANPSLLAGQSPRRSGLPLFLPGFQHGGEFTVGGTGGADSQLVAFRATPGEEVSITPQQQSFRMPVAAPGQINVSFGGRSQIDVTGLEGASQATVDAAIEQFIQINQEAIKRILRRHGVN